MKKKLIVFVMLAALLVSIIPLTVSAIDPNAMHDGKQFKIGSVKISGAAPVCDGEVLPGEYPTEYVFTNDSDGIKVSDNPTMSYVKLYLGHDDDLIYLAGIVQEDDYLKKSSNSYSQLFVGMGLHTGVESMNAAMDRFGMTFSINADDTLFSGNGFYDYTAKGGGSSATSWSYMGPVMPNKNFVRTKDADGKNITVYEMQISKSVMLEAYSTAYPDDVKAFPNTIFFYFWCKQYDGNGASLGEIRYADHIAKEDPEYAEYFIQDSWCATFVGNLLGFYDTETDMVNDLTAFEAARLVDKNGGDDTTALDTTTEAPADTTVPGDDTTAGASEDTTVAGDDTTAKPADDTTTAKPADTTAKPADTTVKPAEEKKGGCGGFAAAGIVALVAALGAGITVLASKKF